MRYELPNITGYACKLFALEFEFSLCGADEGVG
jgi:hypothetical protein